MSIRTKLIHFFGGQTEQERWDDLKLRNKVTEAMAALSSLYSGLNSKLEKIDALATAQIAKSEEIERLKNENKALREQKQADMDKFLTDRLKALDKAKKDDKEPTQTVYLQLDQSVVSEFDQLHKAGYIPQRRSKFINNLMRAAFKDIYLRLGAAKDESDENVSN